MSDKYEFFWGGYCSQWYTAPMIIGDVEYNCCEQWMMFNKALTFGDFVTAKMIMNTYDPSEQKKLGRGVVDYNDDDWMAVAYKVVVDGNMAKFTQHKDLNEYLKSTGDKIIVEASPYDRRWGIGLAENAPGIEDPSNWRGDNLLGKAIMEVRDQLFGEK